MSSSLIQTFTPNTGGMEDLYKKMLEQFGSGGTSSYESMIKATNEGNLAMQQAANAGDMDYMNQQFANMRQMAKEQAADWLNINSDLMGKSSMYRSQESAQQFGQDRQLQGDQIAKEKEMQQEQFGQEKRMFLEDERAKIDEQNRNSSRAVNAYKNF
ncbi:hypothetical protein [Nodosilinea nodulosa]|uniref:hypothetical protein n=1 Tax=Nodosilinea nodulosa TaxID=416001 RepID=UPI0002E0B7F6|nr:hypothetical protein [Nodosilinea nodulosa]